MALQIHIGSLILVEEDGYIKRVWDDLAHDLDDHKLKFARVLGVISSEGAFKPDPVIEPLGPIVVGRRLCLEMDKIHLITEPASFTRFVESIDIPPLLMAGSPLSLRVPPPPGMASLPPPSARGGKSGDG